MWQLILSHRCPKRTRRGDYLAWARVKRAAEVMAQRTELGFTRYSQLQAYNRSDLLFAGVRLTRSFVVTSALRRKRGLPIPAGDDRATRKAERWDLVECFSYESRQELIDALTGSAGREALSLLAKAQPTSQRGSITFAETWAVTPDPMPPIEQLAAILFIRGVPELDRTKMQHYWRTEHSELVTSLRRALGYRSYDQAHAREDDELAQIANALGGSSGAPYDAVAVLRYTNRLRLALGFLNPATLVASFRLAADEVGFLHDRRSSILLGRHIIF